MPPHHADGDADGDRVHHRFARLLLPLPNAALNSLTASSRRSGLVLSSRSALMVARRELSSSASADLRSS